MASETFQPEGHNVKFVRIRGTDLLKTDPPANQIHKVTIIIY